MKKIKSLFERNYETDRLVNENVVPGSEWVINGEGVATRKFDGNSCMIKDGIVYKRYDAKNGKTPPVGFIQAQDPDPITGHWPGWVEVTPEDKWHIEAIKNSLYLGDGTYELCGPKIQNNPEKLEKHMLIPHGSEVLDAPRTFSELKSWIADKDIEGIVWHHQDGRMVKIKKKDFGMPRT